MKKLLLIVIVIGLWGNAAAQDYDPELVNTWGLIAIDRDLLPTAYTADVSPAITPYLKVNSDLSFEGVGACNSFTGSFSVGVGTGLESIFIPEFSATDNTCDSESQNNYEDAYFWQLNLPVPLLEYEYSITTGSDGEPLLTLGFGSGFYLYFTPTTLNVAEQRLSTLQVYPNPTSDNFKLNKALTADSEIMIYSVSGLQRKLTYNPSGQFDISDLASGVYFLEITISKEIFRAKVVKR
ncbi:T9SS type A sorting domain-containing protein [Gilvibacter sediminis]|uniref:T9SS type A sorting domain-containing protein n=1 Tax=Gilvibacter sediminis TaxID=379071 RepID=UPI00234FF12D|nr:T9SS type A sorting domain-containing protein [Gilvibacter sediminis]MDC7999401.1 T9SS type A sorting domain-containing protein [Gilvibacter sediminis]